MKLVLAFVCCILLTDYAKGNDVVSWIIESTQNSEVETIADKLKTEHKLTPFRLFNVRSHKGLQKRSELPYLSEWLQTKIEAEYNINIEVAFTLLGKVGELLRISHAGCKGYKCQIEVAKVHSRYQDMIHSSSRVSNYFVRAVIRALKYHKWADRQIRKNKMARALKWVEKCTVIADNLVKASSRMVKQSDVLKNLTEKAYLQTHSDDVGVAQEQRKAEERNNNLSATIEGINKMLDDLLKREGEMRKDVNAIEVELKKYEQEFAKVKARSVKENTICKTDVVQGFGIPGILTFGDKVVKTCHTELDAGDVEMKKSEMQNVVTKMNKMRESHLGVLQMKHSIQKNMTKLYGELAASMKGFSQLGELQTDLERARNALQIAIDTLGIVKTIFLNNKHYWIQVTQNAKEHSSSGDTNIVLKELERDETEEFKEVLMESGFNWIALGKVSRDAMVAMIKVKARVDDTFVNLPKQDQIEEIIKNSAAIIDETKLLIKSLAKQEEVTEQEIEDAKESILEEAGDDPSEDELDELELEEDDDDFDDFDDEDTGNENEDNE